MLSARIAPRGRKCPIILFEDTTDSVKIELMNKTKVHKAVQANRERVLFGINRNYKINSQCYFLQGCKKNHGYVEVFILSPLSS